MKIIKRGEVYWVGLDPSIGSEISKTRPCIVVSNNNNNKYSNTVSIVPTTSKNLDLIFPFEVLIRKKVLPKDSKAKIDQIRTVDKMRLEEKIGVLPEETIKEVEKALMIHLGMY